MGRRSTRVVEPHGYGGKIPDGTPAKEDEHVYRAGRINKFLLRFYVLNEFYKIENSAKPGERTGGVIAKRLGVKSDEVDAAAKYLRLNGMLYKQENGVGMGITGSGINILERAMARFKIDARHPDAASRPQYRDDPDTYHLYADEVRDKILGGEPGLYEVRRDLLLAVWEVFGSASKVSLCMKMRTE